MLDRLKVVIVGLVAVLGLAVVAGSVKADDKKKCETCETVKTVLESARCEGCKAAEKPCAECAKHVAALEAKLACKGCEKGAACESCAKALEGAKCKFCAAKKLILGHVYCGEACEKAGKACPKCEDERKKVDGAIVCKTCSKDSDVAAKKESGAVWLDSYDKAVERAKAEKRLVLADFTGSDWCGWCMKLKKEVFDTPEFQEWAGKNVVLLEVDFPQQKEQPAALKAQNEKLQEKYGIQGYPTILFLDADGKKVGQLGYRAGGAKAWTAEAQKVVDAAKK